MNTHTNFEIQRDLGRYESTQQYRQDEIRRLELGNWRDDLYFPHLEMGFITVPKAAGTTLKYSILASSVDLKLNILFNELNKIEDKQRIHSLLRESGYGTRFERFFENGAKSVLATTRDPLRRLISFYNDKIIGDGWNRYHQANVHRIYGFDTTMSFEAFADQISSIEDREREIHFRSQSDLIPESLRLDPRLILIKAEMLRSRYSNIKLGRLGFKLVDRDFNESMKHQANVTRRSQDMIFDAYSADYRNFGYRKVILE